MKAIRTSGVILLYTCLFYCAFITIPGVGFTAAFASGNQPLCKTQLGKAYYLPRVTEAETHQQAASASPESLEWVVSEVLKNPILAQKNTLAGLRIETAKQGDILILNLAVLKELAPESIEWDLARQYLQEFIPALYRDRLALPEADIKGIKKSFEDPQFINRTVLIVNIANSKTGGPKIRGGMGIIVADPKSEKLPLQIDLEGVLPDFTLPLPLNPQAKWAEIIRTGIDPAVSDAHLFGNLVKITKALLIQNQYISEYYFHTAQKNLVSYKRKLRSLKPVVQFVREGIPEVVVVVQREDVKKEFGK